jgi:hypothetical protein
MTELNLLFDMVIGVEFIVLSGSRLWGPVIRETGLVFSAQTAPESVPETLKYARWNRPPKGCSN